MLYPFRSPTAYAALVAALLTGAISGFFYAWTCSTLWGLDATDPRVAIQAMQAMNDSVQNPIFFPAFFLTPVALGIAALLALRAGIGRAAALLGIAALIYLIGGIGVTGLVNVPMNEALAATEVPSDSAVAAKVWFDYSGRWQTYNLIRTMVSFVSLCLATASLLVIGRGPVVGRNSDSSDTGLAVPSGSDRV